jgi:hypothetical protein
MCSSLIYTGLEEVPPWATELKQLQHLYVDAPVLSS